MPVPDLEETVCGREDVNGAAWAGEYCPCWDPTNQTTRWVQACVRFGKLALQSSAEGVEACGQDLECMAVTQAHSH